MIIETTQDYIIPKGTIFKNIDNSTREFLNGNFEATIGTSQGTTMNVIIDEEVLEERPDIFIETDY